MALSVTLGACSSDAPVSYDYPTKTFGKVRTYQNEVSKGSVFGPDGFVLFGFGGEVGGGSGGGTGVAVNTFLWRASLDTISFMPLSSADPFGGVIITDWYTPPESRNERFKITVYILDRELRADGIRVSVFRQVQRGRGWADAEVPPAMVTDVENSILTRARQLRIASQRA